VDLGLERWQRNYDGFKLAGLTTQWVWNIENGFNCKCWSLAVALDPIVFFLNDNNNFNEVMIILILLCLAQVI